MGSQWSYLLTGTMSLSWKKSSFMTKIPGRDGSKKSYVLFTHLFICYLHVFGLFKTKSYHNARTYACKDLSTFRKMKISDKLFYILTWWSGNELCNALFMFIRQWWMPDTGGVNIPALNDLLAPLGMAFRWALKF